MIFLRVPVVRLWQEEGLWPGLLRSSKLRLLNVSQPLLSTSMMCFRGCCTTFLETLEQDLDIWVNSLTPEGERGLTPCLVRGVGEEGLVPAGGGEGRMLYTDTMLGEGCIPFTEPFSFFFPLFPDRERKLANLLKLLLMLDMKDLLDLGSAGAASSLDVEKE